MEKAVPMKILIVSKSDLDGGAARASYRLHKSLLASKVDSKMLVLNKKSDDFRVLSELSRFMLIINKVRSFFERVPLYLYRSRIKTPFSSAWVPFGNLVDRINRLEPDIVHLHWVSGGMLRLEELSRIHAPIVWTLHDMWVFTGGCHYNEDCLKFNSKCGSCAILKSKVEYDLSRITWNRKNKAFSNINTLILVGLSKWICDEAKRSSLLFNKKVINLPNPIDTNIYKPLDSLTSRNLWDLPINKKLVLFGAMNATSSPRKGYLELCESLSKLASDNVELVIFGSSEPREPQRLHFKTHYLGKLCDDQSLVALYSAVDVMVVPSLQENLSNAIMESLACGTPVVGFNIGGNGDLIIHKQTGYLARQGDSNDLACGIEWVLSTVEYDKLCKNAREKVLKEFDSRVISKKYLDLYKDILNKE